MGRAEEFDSCDIDRKYVRRTKTKTALRYALRQEAGRCVGCGRKSLRTYCPECQEKKDIQRADRRIYSKKTKHRNNWDIWDWVDRSRASVKTLGRIAEEGKESGP